MWELRINLGSSAIGIVILLLIWRGAISRKMTPPIIRVVEVKTRFRSIFEINTRPALDISRQQNGGVQSARYYSLQYPTVGKLLR